MSIDKSCAQTFGAVACLSGFLLATIFALPVKNALENEDFRHKLTMISLLAASGLTCLIGLCCFTYGGGFRHCLFTSAEPESAFGSPASTVTKSTRASANLHPLLREEHSHENMYDIKLDILPPAKK